MQPRSMLNNRIITQYQVNNKFLTDLFMVFKNIFVYLRAQKLKLKSLFIS
jgi:hypothetical protein